jgi:hypothetical protein
MNDLHEGLRLQMFIGTTMTKRFLPSLVSLIAGACSEMPSQRQQPAVVVVAGAMHAAPALPAKALAAPVGVEPAVIPPNAPTKLISVEESAHIRTSEMWSEPITPAT